MRLTLRLLALTIVPALAGAPCLLSAQGGPLFEVSYASPLKAVGIGAGYGFAWGEMTTQTGIWGQATVDYFFVDKFHVTSPVPKDVSHSYYEFNMNFIKPVAGSSGLYIGSGLNYTTEHIDSGNYAGEEGGADLGISIMGGIHFGPLKQAPFLQARYEVLGAKQFIASIGLAF